MDAFFTDLHRISWTMIKLGVIADDFTGGTDISSFLVAECLPTLQIIGVPKEPLNIEAQAVVVSLKSRSCEKEIAKEESLKALRWLKSLGCEHFFFKYCSTFDSTKEGNIGPVTDALMQELKVKTTVLSPALPVNGRTVYQGYLFVKGQLISESPMKDHPLNPMRDSSLVRLMQMQAQGKCAIVNHDTLQKGPEALKEALKTLEQQGYSYVSLDAIDEHDLVVQGEALKDATLVTGGSGLGMALARDLVKGQNVQAATDLGKPNYRKTVVLSGSCSAMTQAQVKAYSKKAPSFVVDIERCVGSESDTLAYAKEVLDFVVKNSQGEGQDAALAPLVYATQDPQKLHQIQETYGAQTSSQAIEHFFYTLTQLLKEQGFGKFVIAGGETSGQVTKALNVSGFYIGPSIAPGVPWVKAINEDLSLALKSGNFGEENFFEDAQRV